MNTRLSSNRWVAFALPGARLHAKIARRGGGFLAGVAAGLLALALAGCGGGGGGSGSSGVAGASAITGGSTGATAALAASTALTVGITRVSIDSPPVVNFTVTNQSGVGMAGLTGADLRFNIAKLVPGLSGGPSTWQNYINTAVGGAVQGSQERSTASYAFGTLLNHGNGTYTYTFATDVKAGIPCPAPCTDADGKALDLSYQPGVTHRVTIEQANTAYPRSAGVHDFVPNGGLGAKRDIVAPATCDECHNEVTMPGTTRVGAKLCVTCHNPGSWIAGVPNTPLDFKVMIHKIHYAKAGTGLPSVLAGTPYVVGGINFSARPGGVMYVQDARNCTRCHDGTAGAANATAQGDNWKLQPNVEACGACHDNVYFGTKPDPAKPYQTKAHSGGVQTDSSACALCHAAGKFTDKKDIVVAHNFPARLAAATAKFKYNIIGVTPTTAGATPVITFSVTDPSNANAPYDIKTHPAFTATASGASTLNLRFGWITAGVAGTPGVADFSNDVFGQAYGQPVSVSVNLLGNPAVAAGAAAGTYTVTSPVAIPAGQTGTLRVFMEGHPAGDVSTAGVFTDQLPVTSVFEDFAVGVPAVMARRTVANLAKCNACHGVLSMPGIQLNILGNVRNNEPGVCVVCHNPNATDRAGRIAAGVAGEQGIDFKIQSHAMHAGQAGKGGFRTQGITIYRSDGTSNDFSTVVFNGKLNICTNCHTASSYQLTGIWAAPTAGGILGTTVSTGASATLSTDNLRDSPTAAVCSSCHDGASAKIHMQDAFNNGQFSVLQTAITEENCSFCHGSGKAFDVKTVHGVE